MRRVPLQRTQFRAKGPQRRAAHPGQRRTLTGFPDTVKARVRSRSQNRCEVHTAGCTVRASAFHHRQLRRHGDHTEANALHVCLACHTALHANPVVSYTMGWLVHSWDDPNKVPVINGSL